MAYRDSYRDRAPTRGTRIFVGGLAPRVNQMDVEDLFSRYGRIMRADLKSRSDGSAFAFVEYDDYRDADDAIRKLDGYTFMGGRLQVEASRPPPRMPVGPRPGQMPGGLFNRQDKRVVVEGLSERTSWQDLKDFGREAGAVAYADVFRDRGKIQGVIEYQSREDVRNAVRKLDGVRLQGNTVYLRPEVESGSRERSRSRSRSRSPPRRRDDDDDDRRRRSDSVEDRRREREEDEKARSASPPVRARSDSPRDRSRSPVRPASRSLSRSPSRSP